MISGEMNSSFGVMVSEGKHLNMDPYGGMNMKTISSPWKKPKGLGMFSSFGFIVPERRHLNMEPYKGWNMKTKSSPWEINISQSLGKST